MNMEIGAKIRQLRRQRGMTQEQLGARLGLSAQAVSKWESNTTTPDIQLLPDLSVIFGVSIDELFSLTDESRMERIGNRLEDVRFLPDREFQSTEQYLKEKIHSGRIKATATLRLAQLYNKRSREYRDLAMPLAQQALLLNPDEKEAHQAVFDAAGAVMPDWNVANHWKTIGFYKDFIRQHPENRRNYLWLMDLLLQDGRTAEAKQALEAMDQVEHTWHYDLYDGLIAKAECDLPRAMDCWNRMVTACPNNWLPWASRADCMVRLGHYDEAIACYEKAQVLQPHPKLIDLPDAIAQIAEICGDCQTAISMHEKCVEICRTDWNITEGELLDFHKREIARLQASYSQN